MKSPYTIRVAVLVAALLACSFPSRAQTEQILDFHSDITLEDNASLQVTETIAVIAAASKSATASFANFPRTIETGSKNSNSFSATIAARWSSPAASLSSSFIT